MKSSSDFKSIKDLIKYKDLDISDYFDNNGNKIGSKISHLW